MSVSKSDLVPTARHAHLRPVLLMNKLLLLLLLLLLCKTIGPCDADCQPRVVGSAGPADSRKGIRARPLPQHNIARRRAFVPDG